MRLSTLRGKWERRKRHLYVGQNRGGNEDQRRLFKEVVKKLF
jgi:hypothetical protein